MITWYSGYRSEFMHNVGRFRFSIEDKVQELSTSLEEKKVRILKLTLLLPHPLESLGILMLLSLKAFRPAQSW